MSPAVILYNSTDTFIIYWFIYELQIWVPPMTLGNPSSVITDMNKDRCGVRVLYNGTLIWTPGDVLYSRCEYNIYSYPFDHQHCYLAFLPWPYLANEVRLVITDKTVETPFFNKHGEWYLEESSTKNRLEYSMSLAEFKFHIVRRSEYFVVNVILPIALLCFLNLVVFLIPVESGERISYTITVLLSFAVFMTLVNDTIPKTSSPMSLLCYYLALLFAGSVFVMVTVAVNMAFYFRDEARPIPKLYLSLVLLFRKSSIQQSETAPSNNNTVNVIDLTDEKMTLEGKLQSETEKYTQPNIYSVITWKHVANTVDKLGFIIFFLYFLSLSVGMMVYLWQSSHKQIDIN